MQEKLENMYFYKLSHIEVIKKTNLLWHLKNEIQIANAVTKLVL